MAFETIILDVREGVATLILNRPDKLNAFNDALRADLRAALAQIASTGEARCLLITGAGRGFCTGADLAERRGILEGQDIDLGESLEKNYNPIVRTLRSLPMPTVAAVNGPCAGAGMSMALACDIIVAGRGASFLQAFSRIGLVPDAGSTWFLPRQIGRARATGMALLGEPISADTAAEWGLVWSVVEDDQLMPEARSLAGRLAKAPTRGLALIRQALDQTWSNDLDQQLAIERDLQRTAGRTADFREGVAAFLEKRKPQFRGR